MKAAHGFSAMVLLGMRVAAVVAMAALLLQASCKVGPIPTVQMELSGDSGCHESAPSMPPASNPDHICCSGDHSPDALLSAAATPAPPAVAEHLSISILVSNSSVSSSADTSIPFSPPPGLLALRI